MRAIQSNGNSQIKNKATNTTRTTTHTVSSGDNLEVFDHSKDIADTTGEDRDTRLEATTNSSTDNSDVCISLDNSTTTSTVSGNQMLIPTFPQCSLPCSESPVQPKPFT